MPYEAGLDFDTDVHQKEQKQQWTVRKLSEEKSLHLKLWLWSAVKAKHAVHYVDSRRPARRLVNGHQSRLHLGLLAQKTYCCHIVL